MTPPPPSPWQLSVVALLLLYAQLYGLGDLTGLHRQLHHMHHEEREALRQLQQRLREVYQDNPHLLDDLLQDNPHLQ